MPAELQSRPSKGNTVNGSSEAPVVQVFITLVEKGPPARNELSLGNGRLVEHARRPRAAHPRPKGRNVATLPHQESPPRPSSAPSSIYSSAPSPRERTRQASSKATQSQCLIVATPLALLTPTALTCQAMPATAWVVLAVRPRATSLNKPTTSIRSLAANEA